MPASIEEAPARTRAPAALILIAAPVLWLSGMWGLHGGGPAAFFAILLGLLSVPVGIGIAIVGVSGVRGAVDRWLVGLYLIVCAVMVILTWYGLLS